MMTASNEMAKWNEGSKWTAEPSGIDADAKLRRAIRNAHDPSAQLRDWGFLPSIDDVEMASESTARMVKAA